MKNKILIVSTICLIAGLVYSGIGGFATPGARGITSAANISGISGTFSSTLNVDSLNSTKGVKGTGINGTSFTINNNSANSVNLNIYGNNDKTDDVNHLNFYRSIGSFASPGALRAYGALGTSADDLFNIRAWGWDGEGYKQCSEIGVVPTQDWTSTAHGCNFQIYLAPNNSTIMQECFRADSDGVSPGSGDFITYNAGTGFKMYAPVNDAISALAAMYKSRGTLASPTAIQSSDPLGQFVFYGHNGTTYQIGAQIIAGASENWTSTNRGSAINFYTVPTGSTQVPEIAEKLYGDKSYFPKPMGIGIVTPKTAMFTVGHDAGSYYGFRLKDRSAGRDGDLDTWDFSTGIWNRGQFTFYNVSTGVKANIDSAGNFSIGATTTEGTEKLNVNGAIAIKDSMTAPSATAGHAKIYVDSADGDLKVIFGNGVIKTLTTDTP